MRKVVAWLVFGLVPMSPHMAIGQPAEAPPGRLEYGAYRTCLVNMDARMRSARAMPERYQLAMSGACLGEFGAYQQTMLAHLQRMPHPGVSYQDAQDITARTMASLEADDSRTRRGLVSAYVQWYEGGTAATESR